MPSRKKAKGKARKAAKKAKAKEESEAVMEVAADQRQEGTLEAHMQRLAISNATTEECWHGLLPSSDEVKICGDFINAFLAVFRSEVLSGDDVGQCFVTAHDATKGEYANVYDSKLYIVISMLLSSGTQYILEGENNATSQLYASFACHFEEYMAVKVLKTKAIFSWTKIYELCDADDHTLVSYYRKRIPCSCLDEKYKEVKSVKKMGWCFNPSCIHPDGRVERSNMFCCTRCGDVNYCSVECQKNHWKKHREVCDNDVKMKAAFDSEQS